MFDGCRKTLLIVAFAAPKSTVSSGRVQKVTYDQVPVDTGCIASCLQLWFVVGVVGSLIELVFIICC